MGLGAPWSDTYLEPQNKEQSSMMFINQLPKITKTISVINPIFHGVPWDDAYL